MRIAVLGSWRTASSKIGWTMLHRKELFVAACESLGEALARHQHHLVVATADKDTADRYVSSGFHRIAQQDRRTTTASTHGKRPPGAAHIAAVEQADAVVIIGGAHGSYAAGIAALHTRKRLIPIGCFGGAAQALLADLPRPVLGSIANVLNELLSNPGKDWQTVLTRTVVDILEAYPRILIIHGRSSDRQQVKTIIETRRSEFPKLPEPVVLKEHTLDAKTIPESFELLAAQVDAAVAVVTPDDLGATAVGHKGEFLRAIDLHELSPRARENVWVEVGWFWGRLGRDRLMIVRRGERVVIPTDLGQVVTHTYVNQPAERAVEIGDFVRKLHTGERSERTERATPAPSNTDQPSPRQVRRSSPSGRARKSKRGR